MGVLFVTHDLSLAEERSDRIGVLYAGEMVEYGRSQTVLAHPKHPYTDALLKSRPTLDPHQGNLPVLTGNVPLPGFWPQGCRFAPRCSFSTDICFQETPPVYGSNAHRLLCHHPLGGTP